MTEILFARKADVDALMAFIGDAPPLIIEPTINSTIQALVTNSTAPTVGSQSTSFNFSELNATNPGYIVSGTAIDDATGGFAAQNTLRVTYTTSGGAPINSAVWGAAKAIGPTSNLVGLIGSAYYKGVVSTNDAAWGVIGFTNIDATSHVGAAIAVEGESVVATGAIVDRRVGVSAASQSGNQGVLLDAAFTVVDGGSLGIAPYNTHGPWKNGFVLSRILYGNQGPPLSADGNVIYADTAFTTEDFADMGLVTFTGNLFNFTNFVMKADGHTVIGGSVAPSGTEILRITSAGGHIEAYASANGVSGINGFQIVTTAFANEMFVGVAEASNTTTHFGQTVGNYSEILAYGASSNGLLIGTVTNKPLILGTNDTARLVISENGNGVIGSATAPTSTEMWRVTAPSAGRIQHLVSPNGVAGFDGLQITDSSLGSNLMVVGVAEAGNTSTRFGQTLGNWSELVSTGASSNGLLIGTITSDPIIFGSNDTARATITATGNFGIGNLSPKTYIDLNPNTASSPALVVSTSLARYQSPDASAGGVEWVSYNNAGNTGNILSGAVAKGTAASPAASVAGQYMFNLRGYGHTGSGWALGGIIIIQPSETWAVGSQGTNIDFYTTPNTTTTLTNTIRFTSLGGLSFVPATDPGRGNLLLKKQAFASLPAASSALEGTLASITDSSTATHGATITGGGANHVLAYCNGTNWVVAG